MNDLILTLSYARNAEGKIDPEEGTILTSYPVHPEVQEPGMGDGEPDIIRLDRRQTVMLLSLLMKVAG